MLRTAFAASVVALVASPAAGSIYSARPEVPTTQRIIARDMVWNCGPAACQGATEDSRPMVLCQSLAKRAGRISSFIVDGREFTAAELGRCNALAAKPTDRSLASQ